MICSQRIQTVRSIQCEVRKWNDFSQGFVYFRGIPNSHWCFSILNFTAEDKNTFEFGVQLKIYIVHCIVFKCLHSNKCFCWLCVRSIFNKGNRMNWCDLITGYSRQIRHEFIMKQSVVWGCKNKFYSSYLIFNSRHETDQKGGVQDAVSMQEDTCLFFVRINVVIKHAIFFRHVRFTQTCVAQLNYWGSSLASRSCIVFRDLSRLARCFSRRAATCSLFAMESFVISICSFRLKEKKRSTFLMHFLLI